MSCQEMADAEVDPILCEGHTRFTEAASVHRFRVQGEIIALGHHPDVFPPSSFGLKFAEHVDFTDCRRAADIGTGTGLLAILAARKGVPEVKATDVSGLAVRLAQQNARDLNAVDAIETRQGHFFGDLAGVFDVITANLPQEIIPPAYQAELSQLQSQAIDGGVGGNAILLDFLDIAPAYMHSGSRLYVIVNTISDYRTALSKIDERYRATLIWNGATAVKTFVRENIDFFRRLMNAGVVCLAEDETGRWHARQFIYCLKLKA